MILVTGGTGYCIGSHTCIALVEVGQDFVLLDNFSNSERAMLQRLESILRRSIRIYEGDIRNRTLLRSNFEQQVVGAGIPFTGLKAVGESSQKPLYYYSNNVAGTLVILGTMVWVGCRKLVFFIRHSLWQCAHHAHSGWMRRALPRILTVARS